MIRHRENRNPSASFDTTFYRDLYLRTIDDNPFIHYLKRRREEGVLTAPRDLSLPQQVKRFTAPGPSFERRRRLPSDARVRAKILAYYLPQFHSFPENDEWWGDGFTEWTNVARGLPRFVGHYQPRVSRDLGQYSLNDGNVLRRQIEMARDAGIYGFIFYFYWFDGRRLMSGPVDRFLADPSLDFPFALMWANENWTRRWDGSEDDVLIRQSYRNEDNEALVDIFAAAFRDPRYIRVGGRPLLMIYRAGIIPDCVKTVETWRELFRQRAGEFPIFVMAQCFGDHDPSIFGMDGAIEFPPHKLTAGLPLKNSELTYLDADATAQVCDYDDVIRRSLTEPWPTYPLIKTLAPSWDNDARRQGNGGLTIHGSTPQKYQK